MLEPPESHVIKRKKPFRVREIPLPGFLAKNDEIF